MKDLYTISEKKHIYYLLKMVTRLHSLIDKDGKAASKAESAYMDAYEDKMSKYEILKGVQGIYCGKTVTIDAVGFIDETLTTYVYTKEENLVALSAIEPIGTTEIGKYCHVIAVENDSIYTEDGYLMSVDDFFRHWEGLPNAISSYPKKYGFVYRDTIIKDHIINHTFNQIWTINGDIKMIIR